MKIYKFDEFINENNFYNISPTITNYVDNFIETHPEKAEKIFNKYSGMSFDEILDSLKKEKNNINDDVDINESVFTSIKNFITKHKERLMDNLIYFGLIMPSTIVLIDIVKYLQTKFGFSNLTYYIVYSIITVIYVSIISRTWALMKRKKRMEKIAPEYKKKQKIKKFNL
jgi:hypothetical protein